jgi:ribosomal-protein-alanine acetyltransferase
MPMVRAAVPADVPRLLEIAAHTPFSAQWPEDKYAKFFSAKADSTPQESASGTVQVHAILVAEDQIGVHGFIAGSGVAGDWELENIAVIPSQQKHGLGRMLLTQFLCSVRERGGTNVFLEVRESNHSALLLYEKAGFIEVGRRKDYYQNPTEDARVHKISFF